MAHCSELSGAEFRSLPPRWNGKLRLPTWARFEILTRAAGSPGKHLDLCWLRWQGPSRGGDVDRITLAAQTDHNLPTVLHNRFRLSCGIEVRKGNEVFRQDGPYTSTRVLSLGPFHSSIKRRNGRHEPNDSLSLCCSIVSWRPSVPTGRPPGWSEPQPSACRQFGSSEGQVIPFGRYPSCAPPRSSAAPFPLAANADQHCVPPASLPHGVPPPIGGPDRDVEGLEGKD
jgi:hypothetical protein